MERTEIFKKLNGIFIEVFNDKSIIIKETTTSDDIEDWDSLSNINLISAIEDEFGLEFEMADILKMKNVGDFVNLIERGLKLN